MKTWMGSRQTRAARELATAADAAERDHRRNCIECIRAVRHRRDNERCGEGWKLAQAKRDTARQLVEERRLDKLPIPGQEPLFGDGDLATASTRQELTP